MMMPTPSPYLSREEELAIWLEKKKTKQQQSKTPASASSFDNKHRSTSRRNFSYASNGTPSTCKTPLSDCQETASGSRWEDSPFLAAPRLSENVSCRRGHGLPRQAFSTVSSRLKHKSLPGKNPNDTREALYVVAPNSTTTGESYRKNRSISMRSEGCTEGKENDGSRVNRIRSRAEMKRGQEVDEGSKTCSTPYRTPLSTRNSGTSRNFTFSSGKTSLLVGGEGDENKVAPDRILDLSVSLTSEDAMSPLSKATNTPSPVSALSSIARHDNESYPRDRVSHRTSCRKRFSVGSVDGESQVEPHPPNDEYTTDKTVKRPQLTTTKSCSEELEIQGHDEETPQDESYDLPEQEPRQALDFSGVVDDDLACDANEFMIRKGRKRRTDSTFLLLPRPAPRDGKINISPDPDRSAFVSVNQRSSSESHNDSGSSAVSPLEKTSTSSLSDECNACATSPVAPEPIMESPATPSSDDESELIASVPYNVVKLNDRAILEAIPEVPVARHLQHLSNSEAVSMDNENQTLRAEVESLRIRTATAENELYALRRAYDERITPFRDLFEEMKKLRLENLVLTKERSETGKMLEGLQQQMMRGLQTAVTKNQELQRKLDIESEERQRIEKELIACKAQLGATSLEKRKLEQELVRTLRPFKGAS